MSLLEIGMEVVIADQPGIAAAFRGKRVRVISNTASSFGQYRVQLMEPVDYGKDTVPIGKHLYAQYDQLVHIVTNKQAKSLLRK